MAAFTDSIAARYEQYMVPLIFAPYASVLAARIAPRAPARILEVACGTGVVTRALSAALAAAITATDLHQAMLDRAAAVGTHRPVTWRQADAMALPFPDASFDAVVCQFGAMFFPDRPRAFAEARRVLAPGGTYWLSSWDGVATNEIADEVLRTLAARYPADPPTFMARIPHGYHDRAQIARDLAAAGFTATPSIETLALCSRAATARDAAVAYCHGTPIRDEILARDPDGLDAATEACTVALAARFGATDVTAGMCAHLVAANN
jgi:ubiquinone/menaquinone biosynthesis C-methylase UbiE